MRIDVDMTKINNSITYARSNIQASRVAIRIGILPRVLSPSDKDVPGPTPAGVKAVCKFYRWRMQVGSFAFELQLNYKSVLTVEIRGRRSLLPRSGISVIKWRMNGNPPLQHRACVARGGSQEVRAKGGCYRMLQQRDTPD